MDDQNRYYEHLLCLAIDDETMSGYLVNLYCNVYAVLSIGQVMNTRSGNLLKWENFNNIEILAPLLIIAHGDSKEIGGIEAGTYTPYSLANLIRKYYWTNKWGGGDIVLMVCQEPKWPILFGLDLVQEMRNLDMRGINVWCPNRKIKLDYEYPMILPPINNVVFDYAGTS